MELEEMKNAWLALGEKLDQKGKLSDIIIREMYRSKVKKSVNTLLRYEYFGVIVCLLVLPLIGWLIFVNQSLLYRFTLGYWAVFDIAAVIWTLKKIGLLMKIDEIGVIKENIRTANTYSLWIHSEKKYFIPFTIIGVIPMTVIYWFYAKPWHWVFMTALLVLVTLITIWGYKRLYARNIRTIQQNLNELDDLKE
ncbi:hypothetical protein [Massilibacteroides vaginae]|uniref:hypothetical protein n=1 Tax=Massilibacteroides vaginae TaxID=1673718 RepID=UPI000A1CA98F|nr:hypothetical protein [Massilibacteroides vaginae]